MYTRKELNIAARKHRENNDFETSGMIEHLIQLKFHYIPQILEYLEPIKEGNKYFPHMLKLKKEYEDK